MSPHFEQYLNKISTWLFIGLLGLSLFSFDANPIAQLSRTDSSVFFYVGSGMADGLVPYRDMFDHKGLLIYFINWLGASLGIGLIGVWLVESVLYVLSMCWLFHSVRQWSTSSIALSVCMVYMWMFFRFASGGNLTETYSVYFILLSWLYFVEDILHAELRKRTLFAAGLAAGAILMLRPNMFAVCIPIGGYAVLSCIKTGDWRAFLKHVVWGLMGLFTIIGPLGGYAVYHGILREMYNCYICFNFAYASGLTMLIDVNVVFLAVAVVLNIIGLTVANGIWRKVLMYNFVFTGISVVLIVMKLQYAHYYIPLIPCFVVPFLSCMIHGNCLRWLGYSTSFIAALLWCVYSLVGTNINVRALKRWINSGKNIEMKLVLNRNDEKDALRYVLPKEVESVLVLGNACEIYRFTGKRSKCRYFYQTVANFSKEIQNSVSSFIKEKREPCIISFRDDLGFFESEVRENYNLVKTAGNWWVWMTN